VNLLFTLILIKSALQFDRTATPILAWHNPGINEGDSFYPIFQALGSAISQFGSLGDLNAYVFRTNYYVPPGPGPTQYACQQFVATKSWIRLNNVAGRKLGGGARVKDIMMNDEWNKMTRQEKSFAYGQQYLYTLADGVTSSGVACYEPQIGGDENPLKQPVFYTDDNLLVSDDSHYMETPFGESFFPSPAITYSRVKVMNLKHTGVHRDATGSVVHEFYTSYDFPTITQRTGLNEQRDKTDPLSIKSLFSATSMDYMTASQGFTIELNDMNGKQKSQEVYQEDQTTPISSVSYYYDRSVYSPGSYRLNNSATVINQDGSTSNAQIGVFFDNINDFRQSEMDNNSFTVQGNVDAFPVFFIPAFVPTFWPAFTKDITRFRSSSTTKVIQRFGILDSTIATDLGSTVKTQNLAYDAYPHQHTEAFPPQNQHTTCHLLCVLCAWKG